MAIYSRCPACGNIEKKTKIVTCYKCGHLGCYKPHNFVVSVIAFSSGSGCMAGKCPKCGEWAADGANKVGSIS